jgi:hypothetical protein
MQAMRDLLAPVKDYLLSMPKRFVTSEVRRQHAVVVVSEGGLGYRDHSQEYGQCVGGSHTLVGYRVGEAARARAGA